MPQAGYFREYVTRKLSRLVLCSIFFGPFFSLNVQLTVLLTGSTGPQGKYCGEVEVTVRCV